MLKKFTIINMFLLLIITFAGCSDTGQKESIAYSKINEVDTEKIETPEDVIKIIGKPIKIIKETKDMEAIIRGVSKNIKYPKITNNNINDAVNEILYEKMSELYEYQIEELANLESSNTFKAYKYDVIDSNNDDSEYYYIFNEDEFIMFVSTSAISYK